MLLPSYKFFSKYKSTKLVVILPGSSSGISSYLISEILNKAAQKYSAVATNYPYYEEGRESEDFKNKSKSPLFKEEVQATMEILKLIGFEAYSEYTFVGKSLGAMVAAAMFLESKEILKKTQRLYILGHTVGFANVIKDIEVPLTVIQGSLDRFGNIETVKKDLGNRKNLSLVEIEGANHSYKDADGNLAFLHDVINSIGF